MFTVSVLCQILLAMGVMVAYFLVGAEDPDIPVMGLSFEQQEIAYGAIQIVAIGWIVVSVYVLGADFWERLDHALEWQRVQTD